MDCGVVSWLGDVCICAIPWNELTRKFFSSGEREMLRLNFFAVEDFALLEELNESWQGALFLCDSQYEFLMLEESLDSSELRRNDC